MQIGMIGLGRMGANMVRRLLKGGHQCVVYELVRPYTKAIYLAARSVLENDADAEDGPESNINPVARGEGFRAAA